MAVDAVLATDPAPLSGQAALRRAEGLLAVQERLQAASLRAVADVDAREAWQWASTGSTRTWLRTLPCGDRGQLAAARALAARPLVGAALADGELSVRTAVAVARLLERAPRVAPAEQVEAVLLDGLGDLLRVWTGAGCLAPTAEQEAEFASRRERLARAVRLGLGQCWGDVADQVEPAFVLAARVLAPAEVEAGLGLLVDALLPEPQLDAEAELAWRERGLSLRKLAAGGWSLRAHLTDETGQLLHDELLARRQRHPLEQGDAGQPDRRPVDGRGVFQDEDPGEDVDAPAEHGAAHVGEEPVAQAGDPPPAGAETEGQAAEERFGAAGPGSPASASGPAVEGTPLPSLTQRDHDALARLLADLQLLPRQPGLPPPSSLTITARLDTVQGRPGAPPATLLTAGGPVSLTRSQLARAGCSSSLAAVLVDACGRPVAASGSHRHATRRERRVLRAQWGSTCAVNGCALPGLVPHHVEPFHRSGRTALEDLVPVCEHHHHDVHEGRKTLRLRDGRLLDERGWADPDW